MIFVKHSIIKQCMLPFFLPRKNRRHWHNNWDIISRSQNNFYRQKLNLPATVNTHTVKPYSYGYVAHIQSKEIVFLSFFLLV